MVFEACSGWTIDRPSLQEQDLWVPAFTLQRLEGNDFFRAGVGLSTEDAECHGHKMMQLSAT